MSFLRNKYHYSTKAIEALGNIEGLIVERNIEELKKYQTYFDKEYNYAFLSSTTGDPQLAEVVSNVEKASESGIRIHIHISPSSTSSSSTILNCEVAITEEVEQQPAVTVPENNK